MPYLFYRSMMRCLLLIEFLNMNVGCRLASFCLVSFSPIFVTCGNQNCRAKLHRHVADFIGSFTANTCLMSSMTPYSCALQCASVKSSGKVAMTEASIVSAPMGWLVLACVLLVAPASLRLDISITMPSLWSSASPCLWPGFG